MPRKENEDCVRVHLWIFKKDYQRLHDYFGDSIGFSKGARHIIKQFMDGIEAKAAEQAKGAKAPNMPDLEG